VVTLSGNGFVEVQLAYTAFIELCPPSHWTV